MSSPADVRERTRIEPGYEIVDGVCVEKDMGVESDFFAGRIDRRLGIYVEDHGLGLVVTQGAGFQFPALDHGKLHFPDVAYFPADRLPGGRLPKGWADFPPELVVEVVSPNDDAEKVNTKVGMWLDGGARMVWVVYPESREIHVVRQDRTAVFLREQDTLTGEDVVPGFSVPVAEIFAVPGAVPKA